MMYYRPVSAVFSDFPALPPEFSCGPSR